jgi:hypothetical protein
MQVIKGNGIESQNQGQNRRPKLLAIKPPIRGKAKAINKTGAASISSIINELN